MDTHFSLYNTIPIPSLGFGSFKVPPEEARRVVGEALQTGYRLIDTASYYQNESGVGAAVRESGIPREEVFVTTKVWMDDLGYDATMRAFTSSMEQLDIGYIDLYLIHWPRPLALESWRALEQLHSEGQVRAIGVSNYSIAQLEELLSVCRIKPAVNQVELHPRLQQRELREFCREQGILIQAWSPLMRGGVSEIPKIAELAEAHRKSPEQITLRWHLQNDILALPKSTHAERIRKNYDILGFSLSEDDLAVISSLDDNYRIGFTPEYIYEHGFNVGDVPPQFRK